MRYINAKTYYSLLRALEKAGESSPISIYDYRPKLGVALEFRVSWGGMGPQTPDSTISFVSALAHASSIARTLTRTEMVLRGWGGTVSVDDTMVQRLYEIISDADLHIDTFTMIFWGILDDYNKEE